MDLVDVTKSGSLDGRNADALVDGKKELAGESDELLEGEHALSSRYDRFGCICGDCVLNVNPQMRK